MPRCCDRVLRSIVMPFAAGAVLLGLSAALDRPARAQLPGQLGNALGALTQGTGGGGGLPSLGSTALGNIAGVLQYCMQNNYLGASNAAPSVEQSLLGKLGGPTQAQSDSGYTAGTSGVLQTGNGQNYSLGGGGIMAGLAQQICPLVLQHAQSLL